MTSQLHINEHFDLCHSPFLPGSLWGFLPRHGFNLISPSLQQLVFGLLRSYSEHHGVLLRWLMGQIRGVKKAAMGGCCHSGGGCQRWRQDWQPNRFLLAGAAVSAVIPSFGKEPRTHWEQHNLVKENKSVWKGSQMGKQSYSAAADLGKLEKWA